MMEENDDFEGDHLKAGTSFSELLFGRDDNGVGLDVDQTFHYPSAFSTEKTPKMLCFGNYPNQGELLLSDHTNRTPQKSAITCSDPSSASSSNNKTSFNSLSKSNKRRNGSPQKQAKCTSTINTTPVPIQKTSRKTKTENPTSSVHAKRKEKLGDRIAALQQLVSPFGKTDTASVLHEAMGYIKFLQDQVQVLCSPYLQRLPSSPDSQLHHQNDDVKKGRGEGARKDLRSRGLCLVPVECTVHVISSNGADFWSPAMRANVLSSSRE